MNESILWVYLNKQSQVTEITFWNKIWVLI